MFEIKNNRKQSLDSKTDALIADLNSGLLSEEELISTLGRATSEYSTYWSNLQSRDTVKQLAGTLIAELPIRRGEMILRGETAVVFEVISDLDDDECLAVLGLVGADSASVHAEIAHSAGQPRRVSFRFESQLPPVLPRHIEAAKTMQLNPRYVPENQDQHFHVATINETKGIDTP